MVIQGHLDGRIERIEPHTIYKIVNGYKTLSIIGGEFAISSDESAVAIKTLLGSCVAIMVYDNRLKIKGMNHFLLPHSHISDSYKYGLYSIESMLNEMYKYGSRKTDLSVKIVGGADVLSSTTQKIGRKNVEFAKNFCHSEGIKIVSENVGGIYGRVVLLINGFKTFARNVSTQVAAEIKKEEDKLSHIVDKTSNIPKESGVTLF